MERNIQQYDAVVLGGGPAGATAAASLARHGRNVAVIEKDKFPRYHVGESLLPFCWFPMERIGVLDKVKAANFVEKHSVQFVTMDGKQSAPFYFFKHIDHDCARTWQVTRAKFDKILLDHAAEHGASVFEQHKAMQLIRNDGGAVGGVVAQAADGTEKEFHAPMTIDATGRNAFSISKNRWRKWDPSLSKMAVWTYFKGAKRDEGIDEGNTTVAYVPDRGWFWYIPLEDDTVSVGVVGERESIFGDTKDPMEAFWNQVEHNVWIKDHLSQGEQWGEYFVTSEYSYRSEHVAEDGLLLAGDAFGFLDPVFSSGVFLALRSGELAGDAVHKALEAGDFSAGQFGPYAEEFISGIESMRKLVYAFYDTGFSFGEMLKKYPDLRPDLTDCLIGNMDTDFDPLFQAVSEFAAVPQPLSYGRPMVAAAS